jgi:aspartyl/glutamyl-tRNA(Asn/Gln) amidotransferase C subunit
VFDNFSKLSEVKTDGIEIAIQPVDLKNKFREDKVVKGLSQEDALKNSKNNKNGFFKGPKAI